MAIKSKYKLQSVRNIEAGLDNCSKVFACDSGTTF